MKNVVFTSGAPGLLGPYSQGIDAGSLIFTSGQLPVNPATGHLENSDIQKAAALCLDSVQAVLEEAGSSLDKVVKVTIYIHDLGDFDAVNEIYSRYFPGGHPARSCVQVEKLPQNALIEIEAMGIK